MEKKIFWILLLIALIFASVLAFFIYHTFLLTDSYTIGMHLTVGNVTGVNVATDDIYFGTIRPGNSVTKIITISNDGQKRKVVLKTFGGFKDWIHHENILLMEPQEKKEIKLTAAIPKDAEYGTYNGKIKVNFYRWQG